MHIDPIEIDYNSIVYSGCSHNLAAQYDHTPLVQRLFRMGYVDFNIQRFTNVCAFPFNAKGASLTMFPFPFQLLTVNHELDYYSFTSLN